MKTIDIRTTQNVTITYELAQVHERILAFVIDSVIKGIALFILWWLAFALIGDENTLIEFFVYLVVLPIATFYTLVFEFLLNGQTPGKQILKIKVIKLNGKQPVFYDYLLRWTFRIMDIMLSSGILAVILIISTDFAQRLGDMTSNSTVVRVSSKGIISLKDILKIDTRQNYEPQYPGIAKFREEDILVIKETIERYTKYNNNAHRDAITKLCKNVSAKLEIPEPTDNKIFFLKTLIKDYIVLTR